MTGADRIAAALAGRPTDRVPTNVVFYEGYMAHCAGREQWEFDYGTAQDQLDMQLAAIRRHPDNDGFWTWTGMNRHPVIDMHVERVEDRPWAVFDDGRRKALDDNPANTPWNRTPDEVRRNHEAIRVRTAAELDEKLGPIVLAAELAQNESHTNLARLVREVGEKTFLWVNFSSLFSTALGRLGGPEEGWIATSTDPALVETVMERCMKQHVEYIDAAAASGGHGMWNCFMNEGANILSPATWRTLVKPFVAPLVKRAHGHGMKYVAWFLDDCRPLVGDLIEMGIDGIVTEQPRVAYKCEPGDLRRLAKSKDICLFGWFWERDLMRGDRDAIRRTLRAQYEEAGNGKPFVVATPGLTQEFDPRVVDMVIEEARLL
ncbi:MAG: uroporphyrinogen decarboxylase family protein [Planctomycetota bacterium]